MPPLPVAKPREAAAQIARALGKVNALQSLCRKSSQFLAYIHLKESKKQNEYCIDKTQIEDINKRKERIF